MINSYILTTIFFCIGVVRRKLALINLSGLKGLHNITQKGEGGEGWVVSGTLLGVFTFFCQST